MKTFISALGRSRLLRSPSPRPDYSINPAIGPRVSAKARPRRRSHSMTDPRTRLMMIKAFAAIAWGLAATTAGLAASADTSASRRKTHEYASKPSLSLRKSTRLGHFQEA